MIIILGSVIAVAREERRGPPLLRCVAARIRAKREGEEGEVE